MNYELLFKNKALEHFELFAVDYFTFVDMNTILHEMDSACKNEIGDYVYKRGIKNLATLYNKYSFIADHPDILTKDDQIAIYKMKKYFLNHKGNQFGYMKYRREHLEAEVVKYYELAMARNMFILANKIYILHEIKRMEQFITHTNNSKEIKTLADIKAKAQRNNWAKKRVKCVCGKMYSQGNKEDHCKTKFHIHFVSSNQESGENIVLHLEDIYPTSKEEFDSHF